MIMRAFVAAIAVLGIGVLVAMTANRTPRAIACSGDPERFDELVRAADVIAIVRAESVGGAANTAPTVRPTFTPPPEGTPLPYPLENLAGVGATVALEKAIAGTAGGSLVVDAARRSVIEAREREREAVWPGLAVNCSVRFMVPSYEIGARYIALYVWTGAEYETTRLVKLQGSSLDASMGITFSKAAYERYFSDMPGRNANNLPGDDYDYIYVEEPSLSVDRLVSFIRVVRGEIAPPETGSAGLRGAR